MINIHGHTFKSSEHARYRGRLVHPAECCHCGGTWSALPRDIIKLIIEVEDMFIHGGHNYADLTIEEVFIKLGLGTSV